MGAIETIFENYKAAHNEETPLSEGQCAALASLEQAIFNQASCNAAFDHAVALSRESEKAGFILGFKAAMGILHECAG